MNSSIWLIAGTLTVTTTLVQSGPGSNVNERALHISLSFRTEVSSSGRIPPLCRDAVGILLYCHLQHHKRHNNKDAGRLYCKGSKRLWGVLLWEGAGDWTEAAIFCPHSYGRQRCVFLVLLMLNQRPRGPLCWVLDFFIASYQQLPWTPTHQSPESLRPGVAILTTSRL